LLANPCNTVASIEKMVLTLEDCWSLLRVLACSATGRECSVYTTFSSGARRPGDLGGPEEYHVVVLDNGRSAMLGSRFQDMLRYIRCAACMNHCPVYGAVGGHAYGLWLGLSRPEGQCPDSGLDRRGPGGAAAQRRHLLRQARERLPCENTAARPDAALARTGIRGAPDPRRGTLGPGRLGLCRAPPGAAPADDPRRRRHARLGRKRGQFFSLPLAGG